MKKILLMLLIALLPSLAAAGPKEKTPHDDFRILWVGRLDPGKGLKYMILAFEQFHSQHTNSRLSIAGDGVYI